MTNEMDKPYWSRGRDLKTGDVITRWNQRFVVTANTMGCVHTEPMLAHPHIGWIGQEMLAGWIRDGDATLERV